MFKSLKTLSGTVRRFTPILRIELRPLGAGALNRP